MGQHNLFLGLTISLLVVIIINNIFWNLEQSLDKYSFIGLMHFIFFVIML